MPLDPRAKRLIDMLAMSAPVSPITTAARREGFAKLMAMGAKSPAIARSEDIHIPGPGGPLRLRMYDPVSDRQVPAPALVFFHGGGLVAGSIETHDAICRNLAIAMNAMVVSVDYRLAPEARFPAALDDAAFAVNWLGEHGTGLKIDTARIAIGGESAGALLSALIAGGVRPLTVKIRAQLLLCPVIDLGGDFPSRREFAQGFMIDTATVDHDIADCLGPGQTVSALPSPLRDGSPGGVPPTIIVAAECDPFRDEAAAYAAHIGNAGVPVRHVCHPGMVHSFYGLSALLPQAAPALREAGEALAVLLA